MPRIPILKLRSRETPTAPTDLASYQPALQLQGINLGVDNLRHDVQFNPKFIEAVRIHLVKAIARHGGVERVLEDEQDQTLDERPKRELFVTAIPVHTPAPAPVANRPAPTELKKLLAEMQLAILNKAKASENIHVDLLGRVAVIKFLRAETLAQFAEVLERCRIRQKSYEGVREKRALEFREKVAVFQVNKKVVLRRTTQELFQLLREIEKETLARTRRSIFGEAEPAGYDLLLNPLLFTEDGRDDAINAEQYVLWGNFDKDHDRFRVMRDAAVRWLRSFGSIASAPESDLDGWLNVPENARLLVGSGTPDETAAARAQKLRLQMWVALLEERGLMEHVLAAYEVVPLLAEFGDLVNAQQLKNALVSNEELRRVETMITEGGRRPVDSLRAAVDRVQSHGMGECSRVAARFLFDLMRYHRDWRKLEALNATIDAIHLIQNGRMRELSAVNGLLYEFSVSEGAESSEGNVERHVIVKADVRDSSRLTQSLIGMGLNPASFFSLNFYDPVNQLLSRYGATKVFLEGDAIILSLVERGNAQSCLVARACALAREMLDIVRGYNQRLQQSGLPALELGLGIAYQDSAPMFLMDGERPIMISEALNESDRLSSSHRALRRTMSDWETPFHVYAFQLPGEDNTAAEAQMQVNVDGIRLSEAAFEKLKQEISLQPCAGSGVRLHRGEQVTLYRGLVAVDKEVFRPILIREALAANVAPGTLQIRNWNGPRYYEICTDASLYAKFVQQSAASGRG